jgi:hypothetical protein
MSGVIIAARLTSYLPTVLLVVSAIVIVIGVPLAYRYWRDLHEDDEPIRKADLLADLERGGAASKMTEDELHRVRELLLDGEAGRKPADKSHRTAREERKGDDRDSQAGVANE